MLRSRSVSLALVALFVWLTGCTSYSQVEIGDLPQKGKVRVTLNDGERQSVHDPWVDGDDLRGWRASAGSTSTALNRGGDLTFKLERVSSIETVHTSAGKTAALVAGIVVAVAAAIGYAAYDSWDCCIGVAD